MKNNTIAESNPTNSSKDNDFLNTLSKQKKDINKVITKTF